MHAGVARGFANSLVKRLADENNPSIELCPGGPGESSLLCTQGDGREQLRKGDGIKPPCEQNKAGLRLHNYFFLTLDHSQKVRQPNALTKPRIPTDQEILPPICTIRTKFTPSFRSRDQSLTLSDASTYVPVRSVGLKKIGPLGKKLS